MPVKDAAPVCAFADVDARRTAASRTRTVAEKRRRILINPP
jgi:hypothetical protein